MRRERHHLVRGVRCPGRVAGFGGDRTMSDLYASALAAIEARRELVKAGTPTPWENVRVPFRDTASHSVKRDQHVLALVGWEREEALRVPADARLITAAVNAFVADTDALAAVLERHAPSEPVECPRPETCGKCSSCLACGADWPCPDAQSALTALGVTS